MAYFKLPSSFKWFLAYYVADRCGKVKVVRIMHFCRLIMIKFFFFLFFKIDYQHHIDFGRLQSMDQGEWKCKNCCGLGNLKVVLGNIVLNGILA